MLTHAPNIAFGLLGVAAAAHWVRYRGRSRAWLAAALGLLGAILVTSQLTLGGRPITSVPGVQQVTLLGFMGSGYALIELRRTLAPMPVWRHRAYRWVVAGVTGLALVMPLLGFVARNPAVSGPVGALLVLIWSACIVEPAFTFWRISRSRPYVQRARLRALSVGYAGLAFAITVAVAGYVVEAATGKGESPLLQPALQIVALATVPLLYSSFAPPRWLRQLWRAKEEHLYRSATATLIAIAPDELTMASRALDGAVRLLGAEGGVLVSPHGPVVTQGLDGSEVAAVLAAAETPGKGRDRNQIQVPLRTRHGEGKLVLVAGPVTPLFGSDEVNRIHDYAVAVTAALERARDSERLSTLLAAIGELGEGLVITEAGRLVYANDAYLTITGYGLEALMGRDLMELASPDTQAELLDRMRVREAGEAVPTHYEAQLVAHDGRLVEVETAVQALRSEGPTRVLALVRDITERKRAERALSDAALVDSLTRIPNRRAWEEELPRAISRARRAGEPLCVAIMDIDRFKEFNDDWGHQRGDRLLADIAAAWSEAVRAVDFVARFGGDEFAVVMPACTGADAVGVLERLDAVTPDHRHTSIGVAEWNGVETPEELVGRADAALLEAKRARSGEVRLAAAGVHDHFTGWATHILRLLADQQMRSAYQPICRLEDLAPVAYEALARPGDEAGMSVEELFAAAHRLGLTRDLDWLSRKVAVQGARHLPAGMLLFVNVSASFLLDPVHDVDQMLLLLRWAGRRPEEIVLEISEREVITDLTRLAKVLQAYRDEGFRFALDDVGEGHSTLEVLTAASAEYIKLARSLVERLDEPASHAAIKAVASFALSTGTQLIAEGVEDLATVATLRELGIGLGQGFGLGRPAFLEASTGGDPERERLSA